MLNTLKSFFNRFREPLTWLAIVIAGATFAGVFLNLGVDFILFVIAITVGILFIVPDKIWGKIAVYLGVK